MKSKKAGILGSGIGTIVGTILILIILIIFTLLSTTTKSLNIKSGTSIIELLPTDSNLKTQDPLNRDLLGIESNLVKNRLTEELNKILISKNPTYSFMEIVTLLDSQNTNYFLNHLNSLDISPAYLEIKKGDTRIICKRTSCELSQKDSEEIVVFLDKSGLQYEYIKLETSNAEIIFGNFPLEDEYLRLFRYSRLYCDYIGERGVNIC